MTIAAIVTACNQKSNRDPITNYDQDDVEEALQGLRKKGAVILIEGGGAGSTVEKHTLYDWFKVSKVELAVMAELMLRGPQTEGDLRARASRMEPLADLAVLRGILEALAPRKLAHFLSPPGQRRGVFVAHGLYPPEEFERVRQAFANRVADEDEAPLRLSTAPCEEVAATAAAPGWVGEVATLRAQVEGAPQGKAGKPPGRGPRPGNPHWEPDRMTMTSIDPEDPALNTRPAPRWTCRRPTAGARPRPAAGRKRRGRTTAGR